MSSTFFPLPLCVLSLSSALHPLMLPVVYLSSTQDVSQYSPPGRMDSDRPA